MSPLRGEYTTCPQSKILIITSALRAMRLQTCYVQHSHLSNYTAFSSEFLNKAATLYLNTALSILRALGVFLVIGQLEGTKEAHLSTNNQIKACGVGNH
jgi:hypothetical protein